MPPGLPTPRIIASTLFVDPLSALGWYSSTDEARLENDLRTLEEGTTVEFIETPSELLLDPDGYTLARRYQMTWPAVRNICRMLCPGLGVAIADLSGYIPRKKNPPDTFYSPEAAVEIYNSVVSRRFEFIAQGTRMLIASSRGHVDAIVGKTYQRLPNIELLSRVRSDVPGTFVSASLASRRFHMWRQTYSPITVFDDTRLNPVRLGLFARNYESGDGSIFLCPAVGFGDPVVWIVRPPCSTTRVRHAGAAFPAKFQEAINSLRPKELWRSILAGWVDSLDQDNLGFAIREDYAADSRHFNKLVSEVRSAGLPVTFARRVVRRAVYSGGTTQLEYGRLIGATRHAWPMRTRLDLMISLIAEAAESDHPWVRERAERYAYTLLSRQTNEELFDVETNIGE